jgi:geranylgeranyl diphosphate synthase type I
VSTVPTAAPREAPASLARAVALVAPELERAVERLNPVLQDPVRHHLAGGGKRVRAALVLVSAAACGGPEPRGIPGAVALELVHNFSLVHDDIIDGDEERRHRPTVWAAFGTGPAIIAGDALATLSLEVLLEEPTPARVAAARTLVRATQRMISGQADDMTFETRSSVSVEECLAMEAGKTGALLGAATAMGAQLAGASDAVVAALTDFGEHLGVGFQIVDDLLGIWGEPEQTGKPVGSDLGSHKKTLPVAAALARPGGPGAELARLLAGELTTQDVARATRLIEASGARDEAIVMADEHFEAALGALDGVELEPGPAAELAEIARYVVERDR